MTRSGVCYTALLTCSEMVCLMHLCSVGYINVKTKKCSFVDCGRACGKTATYGLPGHPPETCCEHAEEGTHLLSPSGTDEQIQCIGFDAKSIAEYKQNQCCK